MNKKYRRTAAFLVSAMLLLTAAVSPAVSAAEQDTGFSDAMEETPGREAQEPAIEPEEELFSDGSSWMQEPEEAFTSGTEEAETESEAEREREELLKEKTTARNAVPLAESDSSTWFATAEELLNSFDTNDSTSQPGKKVYFGQNGGAAQEWWIVGEDPVGCGLVLFAASPLGNSVFSSSTSDKIYNSQTVYTNHYGASDLYQTLKRMEGSYFSPAEQNLIADTTVYTDDRRNGGNYPTTGKLYAAYGNSTSGSDTYVTAGTNASDSLNGGLRIDIGYWGSSRFWLRAPHPNYNNYGSVLVGSPGIFVSSASVITEYSVVPAFQLDLSSVLFASAASTAVSNGPLTTGDTFTLRYTADTSIGSAQFNAAKDSVQVTGAAAGTYLVVQNSEGAYAVNVNGSTSVSASAVTIKGTTLTSFENCKVWLEKTSDRVTKAVLATEGWTVAVQAGTGMTRDVSSGGEEQSVEKGKAIASITYTAADGYYFPDDYSVAEKNGITVTRVSDSEIRVSGTPTADTVLTLPDASQKPKAPTPKVSRASGSASALTITPLEDTDTYGEARYRIDGGTTWQESNVFTNLKAGYTYTVLAKYLGKGIYTESEIGTADIQTDSAAYTISIPKTAQAGGGSVEMKVDTGQEFDLGYNGQVNVKVKADSVINAGGIVTLTRQKDPENKTVTSAMHVNGRQFTDITKNAATFKTRDDPAVSVSFTAPAESGIAAGTYTGTVTFEITYSEP